MIEEWRKMSQWKMEKNESMKNGEKWINEEWRRINDWRIENNEWLKNGGEGMIEE